MFRRQPDALPQFLVFGLGNPGPRYAHTRHNVGWWVLDELARRAGKVRSASRHRSHVDFCRLGEAVIALIKPTTYMNLSGESIAAWLRELPDTPWCVVCDDITMAVGKARFRRQGSAGGHNGLKSIIACLGRDNFDRIKLGVGAPEPEGDAAQHVLDQPPPTELDLLHAAVHRGADAIALLAAGAYEQAVLHALAGNSPGPQRTQTQPGQSADDHAASDETPGSRGI